jgi:hypothetical protein
VATRATVGQPRAEREVRIYIADLAITFERALALASCEFSLEQLAPATNGPEWVTIDYKQRGIRGRYAAATGTYLLGI